MRWSLSLGRLFGIRIRVHASFALLPVWVLWTGWQVDGGSSAIWALVLVLCVFACVLLHELGHSVMAQRFGVQVPSITLLPIGGVASMSRIPEQPAQELAIAVAGPLVNVVLAGLLWLGLGWPRLDLLTEYPTSLLQLGEFLLLANVVMVVFNLIPAFPMDGGRILRSLLALFLPYARATALAAGLGRLLAIGFVIAGFRGAPMMVLIGAFVFFGAGREDRMVQVTARLRGWTVRDAMRRAPLAIAPEMFLEQLPARVHAEGSADFAVCIDGRLAGVLPAARWLRILRQRPEGARVGDAMITRFSAVRADAELSELARHPELLRQGLLPVVEQGAVVGLLRLEDIQRLAAQPSRPSPPLSRRPTPPRRWSLDVG